ncbi:MAG: thioredoxin-disulfide reductase [Sphingomonadales bacterium]|nr:thioredoxin-disulfide reductase [Sphingomonadales bacterium]MBM3923867.1 thioredoxin-disulfide reductase [Sphingomonadales bacterium]
MEHHAVLIIGSGPAGYTAAIYAARAGLNPLLYQGLQPGGQLTITTEVENYPGYAAGVQGPQMMEDFRQQALRMGTEIRYGIVTKVDLNAQPKRITVDGQVELTADAVIIATGASAKWLGLPSEQRLNGHGVSACAVCDGFFFRGQDVAVVGGGDTAAEEATYLAKICKSVHLIVRRDELRASKAMQERVFRTPNLTVHWNSETDEILGAEQVEGVRLRNTVDGSLREIAIQGFFVAIGHTPNTSLFQGQLDMDETGYLLTMPGSTWTKIEGVFAAGDAQDKIYRQAVTAAGTGCMAALDAERWLAARGHA